MYFVLYAVTALAFLGFGAWFLAAPGLIPVVGMAISVAGMIGSWLTDEDRKKKEADYWQERRLTIGISADRVEKELDTLFAIRGMRATGRGANPRDQTAVQPAYDLLNRDISLLTSYWAYSSLAKKAMTEIAAIQKKPDADVNPLLRVVEKLSKKLKSDPAWVKAEQ
jgi:hypothetical protein